MKNKQLKLENPARLAELNPVATLHRIGLKPNHIVSDIGAGSGIFTIPAATMTSNTVYAAETDAEMLQLIKAKAAAQGISNIELIQVEGDRFDIADRSSDLVLMVTVIHEIDDKIAFMAEIGRILKPAGKLAVIEFHKRETPMGPPLERRLDESQVESVANDAGFSLLEVFSLGDNCYCQVFVRSAEAGSLGNT